eukprot:5331359-Pyramimonas_sp.AAC.2
MCTLVRFCSFPCFPVGGRPGAEFGDAIRTLPQLHGTAAAQPDGVHVGRLQRQRPARLACRVLCPAWPA